MLDLLSLTLAQQTVIHKYAGELLADSLVHQSGRHSGVHAARQSADDLIVADHGTDLGHLILDDAGRVPIVRQSSALVQEVFDELLPQRRVLDFGMPLHAIEFAAFIGHGSNGRTLSMSQHAEAFRGLIHCHAVAHPRVLFGRRTFKNAFGVGDDSLSLAVFAKSRLIYVAAQLMRHDLEAIANAKHGNSRVEDLLVDSRRTRLEYRGRATGQDDCLRILG